ncbi:MAG: hypothetical protein HN909_09505 [Phycisphaerales bacterium]|nr:hypothetical protein [Phycisphaerales bacterium]
MAIDSDRLREYIKAEGNDYPFRRGGRILRAANPQDLIDFRHFKKSSTEASHYCKEKIAEMKLAMRLVSVEHLIGGERIIFYFNSEERVDFRILVKDLASRFRTRIEMRQVGARDEARLVADYERCGQRCCCQQYLKPLKPISMRMAKVQKATLDPSKISGRCGRLMCCLRYEDETYTTLKKNLPRKSSWIRTETLLGRVLDSQILTQLTRIALPDRTLTVVPIADIIERDLPEPSEDDLNNAVRDMNRARRQAQAAATGSYQPAPAPAAEKPADKPKRNSGRKEQPKGDQPKREGGGKRRRRRRKPAGQEQGQGQGQKQSQGQPKQGQPQGGQEKSPQGKSDSPSGEAKPKRLIKRRRRRRRKPSDGGQGPASPPAPQGS